MCFLTCCFFRLPLAFVPPCSTGFTSVSGVVAISSTLISGSGSSSSIGTGLDERELPGEFSGVELRDPGGEERAGLAERELPGEFNGVDLRDPVSIAAPASSSLSVLPLLLFILPLLLFTLPLLLSSITS